MSEKLLKTEKMMTREEIAEHLHSIADSLSDGLIELTAGDDSVTLQPAERAEFELEVEQDTGGEMSLEIDIEWHETRDSGDLDIK